MWVRDVAGNLVNLDFSSVVKLVQTVGPGDEEQFIIQAQIGNDLYTLLETRHPVLANLFLDRLGRQLDERPVLKPKNANAQQK